MKASKRAFTLVELLVTVAVMGLLSVGLLGFLGNFLDLKIRAEAKLRIREEGNYALDRIEYLVRNSITLPDICMQYSGGYSTTNTLEDQCKASGCTTGVAGIPSTSIIKFNLRGENRTTDYIHRMRVFFQDNELIEVSTYPSGKTHSDTLAKTDGYSLTRAGSGSISAASNSFKVTDFKAQCFYDKAFTNGYIVNIKFNIKYERNTLNNRSASVEEHFERNVAVRNTGNFQN
ncbi:type II secretion system protein [bacterium]|nr:type II secretion system protein [bacterium]